MKTFLLVFGVFYTVVHASLLSDTFNQNYDQCMDELRINGARPTEQCVSACVKEKKGLIADGKFLVDKYVAFYVKAFPEAKKAAMVTLARCLRKANEYTDKCKMNEVLIKCQNKNSDILYGQK